MRQAIRVPDPRTVATRARILEATMELTLERGPLAITMGEIAERAGVERITLYRHFGDERRLHQEAAAFCMRRYPPPAVAPLLEVHEPIARTRRALEQLYAHWERMAPLARPILRDADIAPDRVSVKIRDRYVEAIRSAVLDAFPARARRRRELREAVRHAFDFRTWDSLNRGGLSRRRSIGLMVTLIAATSGGPSSTRL
jgi:AcrR family transcriptional regulator